MDLERLRVRQRPVVGGLVAALVIVAVPALLLLAGGSSGRNGRPVTGQEAVLAVRAAVGRTLASGSYETNGDNQSTDPTRTGACPPGVSCPTTGGPSTFGATSHGIVNLDPFVTRIDSEDSYGSHTLYVTPTTVWLSGQGAVGPPGSGIPLSEFASSVEGALGPSAGALAIIALASPGGALNLEEQAIAQAAPAGTGSVDGTSVTYYDVTIDMTKLAGTPDLSDVERETIAAALPLLGRGGYRGTTERVGVDPAGYVREVTATNHFTDGSTSTHHTVLSHFGCAPTLSTPDQGGTVSPARTPCPAPNTAPITTLPASASTTSPTTSTSSPPAARTDTDAIRAVFLAWIDAQPHDALDGIVEDYASIADAIRAGMAQHTPEDLALYSGRVDSIEIVDPTHANVTYTVLHDGVPQFSQQAGAAIKVDGVWMVSRDTVCALLAHGGVTCPPRASTKTGS